MISETNCKLHVDCEPVSNTYFMFKKIYVIYILSMHGFTNLNLSIQANDCMKSFSELQNEVL